MLNSPVYMHESFAHLFDVLYQLGVFDLRYHKIPHSLNLIGNGTQFTPPSHWIPLPIVDVSMKFVEVIPRKRRTNAV